MPYNELLLAIKHVHVKSLHDTVGEVRNYDKKRDLYEVWTIHDDAEFLGWFGEHDLKLMIVFE